MAHTNDSKSRVNWKKITADFASLVVEESISKDDDGSKSVCHPIITSSVFRLDQDENSELNNNKIYDYGRLDNPTRDAVQSFLATLDGAKHANVFGSGMGAMSAVVNLVNSGEHIIASTHMYSGSVKLLAGCETAYGISVDFVDSCDVGEFIKLIKPSTKMILWDTISNPLLYIIDIEDLVKRVRAIRADIILAADNTFLTPIFQRPLEYGIDLAIYSGSKYLGGHGDLIMGAVTTNSRLFFDKLHMLQQKLGAVPSPFDCYMMIRSLKTLPLRMNQHNKNALKVARFLEGHPHVEKVLYPGLATHPQHELALRQQCGGSGMIGFFIKGGMAETTKFLNSIRVVKKVLSLGHNFSGCSNPYETWLNMGLVQATDPGVHLNFIRFSVGLETAEIIMKDVDQALRAAKAK